MNQLLTGELFSGFLLKEASVVTGVSYQIDGHKNAEYYEDSEEGYIPFKDVCPILFQMIKGKRTPLSFHMVLHLNPCETEKFLQGLGTTMQQAFVSNLVLNIRFDELGMQVITAMDYSDFTLDKEVEKAWDQFVAGMLVLHL